MEYQERLSMMNLPPLEERRRGDMIQMLKCMSGMGKIDRDDFLELDMERKTRGSHKLKLRLPVCKTDTR